MPIGEAARRTSRDRGLTLVELMVTSVILGILAMTVIPVGKVMRQREREIVLRRALREVRTALDMYHVVCKQSLGQAPPGQGAGAGQQVAMLRIKVEDDLNQECYPSELALLVEGAEVMSPTAVTDYKLRFLRRIPVDPFNTRDDRHDDDTGWVLRSTTDDPERSTSWDRHNVFDIHSGSEAEALDGSRYKEW